MQLIIINNVLSTIIPRIKEDRAYIIQPIYVPRVTEMMHAVINKNADSLIVEWSNCISRINTRLNFAHSILITLDSVITVFFALLLIVKMIFWWN